MCGISAGNVRNLRRLGASNRGSTVNETLSPSRKLSAIFAADAAGYSRLMAQDESATLGSLNRARAVFRRQIESHHGRVLDTSGDSVLAEFSSPVEAVNAAIGIEGELDTLNATEPEDRRMRFRIGINLGDVIEQADSVYGDDVNTAVSLQQRARPGHLCISGTVLDHVVGKMLLRVTPLREPIGSADGKRVRAYLVETGIVGTHRDGEVRRRKITGAVAVAMLYFTAGGAYRWNSNSQNDSAARTGRDPFLAMPSGPVIAVLPFHTWAKSHAGSLR